MPPGVYCDLQDVWEKDGRDQVTMEFLLPTGIYLSFPVARSDTIATIKKVKLVLDRTILRLKLTKKDVKYYRLFVAVKCLFVFQ